MLFFFAFYLENAFFVTGAIETGAIEIVGLGVTRHAGVQTRLPGNEYICITSSELFHII